MEHKTNEREDFVEKHQPLFLKMTYLVPILLLFLFLFLLLFFCKISSANVCRNNSSLKEIPKVKNKIGPWRQLKDKKKFPGEIKGLIKGNKFSK